MAMAPQLGTPPITGYRRRGTRLAELRSLLGSGITAHAILEPLQSCPAEASAKVMRDLLIQRDFDVAGVQSRQEGAVLGFVARDDLESGLVEEHLKPLTADQLISDSTPLPSVLAFLKDKERAFVLIGPQVRGVVTQADLNKPPVRVYLFGLISLLEMHLAFWIRAAYGDESWQRVLKNPRLDAAKKVQADRQTRNQDASLLDCLQFCDKRDLVVASDDLRNQLNLKSRNEARSLLKRAEHLRNNLAHSQHDIVKGSSWKKTIQLVERVEVVVLASDERVEKKAMSSANRGKRGLWASA